MFIWSSFAFLAPIVSDQLLEFIFPSVPITPHHSHRSCGYARQCWEHDKLDGCPSDQIRSDQSLSCVWLFATTCIAARQASLSITNSQSLLKLMSIELVILTSHSLLSRSPTAFNLSQHQGLFKRVSSSHQVAKVLEFQLQHQSFQWIFRTDFL